MAKGASRAPPRPARGPAAPHKPVLKPALPSRPRPAKSVATQRYGTTPSVGKASSIVRGGGKALSVHSSTSLCCRPSLTASNVAEHRKWTELICTQCGETIEKEIHKHVSMRAHRWCANKRRVLNRVAKSRPGVCLFLLFIYIYIFIY